MKVITYSLYDNRTNSSSYYLVAQALAKRVPQEAKVFIQPIITAYQSSSVVDQHKSHDDCILELLLLGVYGRRRATIAESLAELEQSNDFPYLGRKLRFWFEFLTSQPHGKLYLALIKQAVDWFAPCSLAVLGDYTKNVDLYLAHSYDPSKEDAFFCGSTRLEYHISMVGAEILNNIYRKRFLATKEKAVVVPGCMRDFGIQCSALPAQLGYKCQHCTDNCLVNHLTQLGSEYGFTVSFVKHQSILESSTKQLSKITNNVGIVGVACVPSLLEGGYMLEEHNFPAQCVLLDYCGCTNHWDQTGLATSMSIKRLLEIMAC